MGRDAFGHFIKIERPTDWEDTDTCISMSCLNTWIAFGKLRKNWLDGSPSFPGARAGARLFIEDLGEFRIWGSGGPLLL